ncbi:hypothetical protein ACFV1W_37195 [Kitasatospora sp. NPDC059648]|uniref:hypothetical protein n=1 Tax=Kitasatospora sp. NPDC059648 TaxID=3346894 RepID=UPI00367D70EA
MTSNSLFGPVTDQERTRWQLQGARALTDLLTNAFHEQLPAIDWQLQTGSALLGQIRHPGQTPADLRAAFTAWALYLGAVPTENTHGGRTTLRAKVERHPAYGVDIVVLAEFYADEQD